MGACIMKYEEKQCIYTKNMNNYNNLVRVLYLLYEYDYEFRLIECYLCKGKRPKLYTVNADNSLNYKYDIDITQDKVIEIYNTEKPYYDIDFRTLADSNFDYNTYTLPYIRDKNLNTILCND